MTTIIVAYGLLTDELYRSRQDRFVREVFSAATRDYLPNWLQPASNHSFASPFLLDTHRYLRRVKKVTVKGSVKGASWEEENGVTLTDQAWHEGTSCLFNLLR